MRGTAFLVLLAAVTTPLTADTVHLVNGNKFDQVVAERLASGVRIRLPYGEIVLPERVVERVERSESAWQEYDQRADALRRATADAEDWLRLANWADDAGYSRGVRQAALRAAAIDPAVEGLAPFMSRIGHLRDRETGEWLSEETYMRRRGYRLWGDHWLPATEHAARLRVRQEEERTRREEARQERLTRAIEALAIAQLRRPPEPAPEPRPAPSQGPLVAVYSGAYYPFAAPVAAVPAPRDGQVTYDDLIGRQPGSLFPVQPRRR